MTSHTGKHLARRAAAKAEPSPITALRDMLATAFAADIAAVTPMVCDILREGIAADAVPARRALVLATREVLSLNAGALALEVAQAFRVRFDLRLMEGADAASKGKTPGSANLALLDEMQLETNIALDQCVTRLKEQTSTEMFQLTARVATMMDKASLEEAGNPVVPRVFVCTLLDALGKIGLGSEQQLIAFRGFGPPLLHIAPDLYSHANQLLAEFGVLADFTASYGRPLNSQPDKPAPLLETAAADQTMAELLERLLNGVRASEGHSGASASNARAR